MNAFSRFRLLLLLVSASSAPAAIISRDWKAPGDGLLTYDDVNRREWLDVSESSIARFSTSNVTDVAIADAKLQLLPGGVFEGFTLATRVDVEQLIASAGIDVSSASSSRDSADEMRNLLNLMRSQQTPIEPSGSGQIIGVIDEQVIPANEFQNTNVAASIGVTTGSFPAQFGFGNSGDSYRVRGVQTGTKMMLYRAAVPEPSTMIVVEILVGVLIAINSHRVF